MMLLLCMTRCHNSYDVTQWPALVPTQLTFQWVLGILSPRVNLPGCEIDRSPSSRADVKNVWNYT